MSPLSFFRILAASPGEITAIEVYGVNAVPSKYLGCGVATLTNLTVNQDALSPKRFDVTAQVVHAYVDRTWDCTGFVFGFGSHVNEYGVWLSKFAL